MEVENRSFLKSASGYSDVGELGEETWFGGDGGKREVVWDEDREVDVGDEEMGHSGCFFLNTFIGV